MRIDRLGQGRDGVNNSWSNESQTLIVITDISGYSGLFFYSPLIGTGDLVGSWTATAGTDPYGNPYPAGFMIQDGASRIIINSVLGIITESFVTGNPHVDFSAFIQAGAPGIGIAQVDQWLVSSAQNSTYGDTAGVVVQSNNSENTNPAKAYLYYESPTGGQNDYLTVSAAGAVISAGNITATQPGTGTSLTDVAVSETWHDAALTADFTTSAADQVPRYRLEPIAGGVVRLDGAVYTSAATPADTTMFTLPDGYRPLERKRFVGNTNASGYTTIGGALVAVSTAGVVSVTPTTSAAEQQIVLDGMTFPVD